MRSRSQGLRVGPKADVSVDDLEGLSEYPQRVAERAKATGSKWLPICADVEAELRAMDDADREAFMADLGVKESGLARLVRATRVGALAF